MAAISCNPTAKEEMPTPTLHFICGPVGSGKTTYAIAVAHRVKAVRFSIDEWIARLFGKERPDPCPVQWTVERAERCKPLIWELAERIIEHDGNTVFDIGLPLQDERDAFRSWAMGTRAAVKMHYLDVDRETRLARIERRNGERAAPFPFEVTPAMFEALDRAFEPPTDDELYGAMIVVE
jgi:predicted kinase